MSRTFREMFCGHIPWKLKKGNLQKLRQIFAALLAKLSETFRQNFALGERGRNRLN